MSAPRFCLVQLIKKLPFDSRRILKQMGSRSQISVITRLSYRGAICCLIVNISTTKADQKTHFISISPFYKQFENTKCLIFQIQREIENTDYVEFPRGSRVMYFYFINLFAQKEPRALIHPLDHIIPPLPFS